MRGRTLAPLRLRQIFFHFPSLLNVPCKRYHQFPTPLSTIIHKKRRATAIKKIIFSGVIKLGNSGECNAPHVWPSRYEKENAWLET